jgi:hypothetical protein
MWLSVTSTVKKFGSSTLIQDTENNYIMNKTENILLFSIIALITTKTVCAKEN